MIVRAFINCWAKCDGENQFSYVDFTRVGKCWDTHFNGKETETP